MTFNLSAFDNSSNILEMTIAANSLADNFLSIMILLLVWIITAVLLGKFGFKTGSLIASFGTSVVAFTFLFVGLIGLPTFIVCLIVLFANLIVVLLGNK